MQSVLEMKMDGVFLYLLFDSFFCSDRGFTFKFTLVFVSFLCSLYCFHFQFSIEDVFLTGVLGTCFLHCF